MLQLSPLISFASSNVNVATARFLPSYAHNNCSFTILMFHHMPDQSFVYYYDVFSLESSTCQNYLLFPHLVLTL